MLGKLACSALALATLAGCSFEAFTYTLDEYGDLKATRVRLGCSDAYEVYDRPPAGRLLVVTNGINEAVAGSCPGLAGLPREERMRRAATIHLSETTSRPDCRVVRETALSEFHREYAYRCTPARSPAEPGSRPR